MIESAKRLGLNPRDYLADVLPRLANGTTSVIPSLNLGGLAPRPLRRPIHGSHRPPPTGLVPIWSGETLTAKVARTARIIGNSDIDPQDMETAAAQAARILPERLR